MSRQEESRWESLYRDQDVESLPWFYPGLDPDFEAALNRLGISGGEMLDLCTGPGTQALAMAERGYSVTAMDVAATAVKKACLQAAEKGLDIVYRQADILKADLGRRFDFVFDRGCYHVFRRELRKQYVPAVGRLLRPGGYLLLKCFSIKETRPEGPYRIAPEEVRQNFSGLFEIVSIDETVFQGTMGDPLPQALFCVMKKRAEGKAGVAVPDKEE